MSLPALSALGCHDNREPADAATLKAYKDEQTACVADAGTLQAADDCTDAVKAKYGRK